MSLTETTARKAREAIQAAHDKWQTDWNAAYDRNARAAEAHHPPPGGYPSIVDRMNEALTPLLEELERESQRMCARVETGAYSEDCPFCLAKKQTPGIPNPMCHLCEIESRESDMQNKLSALRADKARLDWLEKTDGEVHSDMGAGDGPSTWFSYTHTGSRNDIQFKCFSAPTLREAIDASIAARTKQDASP